MPQSNRQLAAIMFTDIAGYTALMDKDEEAAFDLIERNRTIHKELIEKYNGKFLKEMGDGILASFSTVTDAVYCAGTIQVSCEKEKYLNLRIGIHQGEIVRQGNDVFGSGVNIASRIEAIAPVGGIWVSDSVQRNIQNKKGFEIEFVKEERLKNVRQPVKIYNVKVERHHAINIPEPQPVSPSTSKIIEKSIAVLPFVNMSSDPEQEFFSDGISEEIINTIVQLPNLRVSGRTSSFSFKGKNEDLRVIGKNLGVKNILEGSVRKFANKVRVTAQLIEVSTGFHLWSRKYDRELDDVFKIQDEIALEIADQLKLTFSEGESMPKSREQTQSIAAYQLYYKGRSFYYQRGMALFEALKCFQSALEIDPNYALAASGLADTYIMLCFYGFLTPEKCWSGALPAAQKALKYGPNLGETHNTLAVIALLHDRNFEKAEKEFLHALELNPTHVQARTWYGLFYLSLAVLNFKEGLEQLKIGIENDPLSSYAHSCFALALATADKTKESIELCKYAIKLDPKSMLARFTMGYSYLCARQLDDALRESQISLELSNRNTWDLNQILLIYLKMNEQDKAQKIYQEIEARYENENLPPSHLAVAAAAMGKDEYALELTYRAIDVMDPYLPHIITRWATAEALRKIPGFDEVSRSLGYSKKK